MTSFASSSDLVVRGRVDEGGVFYWEAVRATEPASPSTERCKPATKASKPHEPRTCSPTTPRRTRGGRSPGRRASISDDAVWTGSRVLSRRRDARHDGPSDAAILEDSNNEGRNEVDGTEHRDDIDEDGGVARTIVSVRRGAAKHTRLPVHTASSEMLDPAPRRSAATRPSRGRRRAGSWLVRFRGFRCWLAALSRRARGLGGAHGFLTEDPAFV